MTDTSLFIRVRDMFDQTLNLQGRSADWTTDTPLLGSIPEFDSIAVVTLISAIEQTFHFHIDDDDISASIFATLGSLLDFIAERIPPSA